MKQEREKDDLGNSWKYDNDWRLFIPAIIPIGFVAYIIYKLFF